MYVTYTAGFGLFVGPQNGPMNCTVTANPTGCSFNPLILDGTLVPEAPATPYIVDSFRLPGLGSAAAWGLGALVSALGAILIRRVSRRRR